MTIEYYTRSGTLYRLNKEDAKAERWDEYDDQWTGAMDEYDDLVRGIYYDPDDPEWTEHYHLVSEERAEQFIEEQMHYNISRKIAKKAHEGQVDKAGVDYIKHPLAVAAKVDAIHEKCVALLHDVIEDTDVTAQDLIEAGLPESVVEAVVAITKVEGESYDDYLSRVKANDLARVVKIADLRHNSDLSRLPEVTEKDKARVEKYAKALAMLESR